MSGSSTNYWCHKYQNAPFQICPLNKPDLCPPGLHGGKQCAAWIGWLAGWVISPSPVCWRRTFTCCTAFSSALQGLCVECPSVRRCRYRSPCPWHLWAGCCQPGRRTCCLWRSCCSSRWPGRSPTKARASSFEHRTFHQWKQASALELNQSENWNPVKLKHLESLPDWFWLLSQLTLVKETQQM